MRIGLLTDCYTPVLNGVTRMVTLYQQGLAQAGHEARIFTFGAEPAGEDGAVVRRAPGWRLGQTGYSVAGRLPRHVQAELAQMEVLHAHHLFVSLSLARRYARPGVPVVYTNHTRYDLYTAVYLRHYLPLLPPRGAEYLAQRLLRWLWPRQTALADMVLAPSTAVDETMRQFGMKTPSAVIPNGIELDRFAHALPLSRAPLGLPLGDCLVVSVGRLAAEKRVGELLTAVQIARQQYQTPLHLWLIGDGPYRPHLQQQAATLGLTPHVTFAGAIPPDQLPRYLATADLYATASVSEVHPLTVLEAMAVGLPLVAYAHPSWHNILAPSHALLSPNAEPAGLAHALHQLATQPELRQGMGQAARQHSAGYDMRRTVQATLAVYESLLPA